MLFDEFAHWAISRHLQLDSDGQQQAAESEEEARRKKAQKKKPAEQSQRGGGLDRWLAGGSL